MSIKTALNTNGIPSPAEYIKIKIIPFIISCFSAINNKAELKNVPIHGVQLIENNIPNKSDFIKLEQANNSN